MVDLSWEKVIIAIVIGVLTITSAYSLNALGNYITREEAIDISKNSGLVKEGLRLSLSFTIETHYYNSSMLDQLRNSHNVFWKKVPEGHTAWEVIWWFGGIGAPSEGYPAIVIVDADTGTIIHEEKGVHLL